jgi:hypothetical protein
MNQSASPRITGKTEPRRKSVDVPVDYSEEKTILSFGGRIIIDPKGFKPLTRDSDDGF